MAIPQNKDALLKAINGHFDKLLIELEALPETVTGEMSLEGHARNTLMSVANLVAYLIGWNELVLKWIAKDRLGETIDFPESGFKWNDLGALAQKFYHDYRELPYLQLLERLIKAKHEIAAFVEASNDDVLYGRPWYGKWTLGRMIQFNTASPYNNARGRLRKWSRNKNG